ncbi:kinesin motor domain protein [Ceratobasidium sp. AG-Ba]|nr:kinesin motor domain protein [Ceratobasidium sp. AG-Ba]
MSLSTSQIEKNSVALSGLLKTWLNKNPEDLAADLSEPPTLGEKRGAPKQVVTVALRTRPFLANEAADDKKPLAGVHARGTKMVVHVPAAKWSGPTIQHNSFEGDFSFGPESSSKHVYESLVVKPGLLDTVFGGGVGCILAYGQTGSGKTHTISSLEEIIARDIFPAAKSYAEAHFPKSPKPAEEIYTFGLSLYELLGNKVSDLLDRDLAGNGANVDIVEDKLGEIRVSAKVLPFSDTKELESLIASATGHRRTSATLKNETSSRSHCVLTITIANTLVPSAEPGCLVLVDLAGSERAADRSAHTKERMDEARLINTSLMALKDCVRGRALVEAERSRKGEGKIGFQHIPYRSSKLTLALKPVFDVEATRNCKTVVVAHVSPHLADASHSNNTLTYISPFRVTIVAQPNDLVPSPSAWSNEEFRAWVSKMSTKIDPIKFAPFESGKQMCELDESIFIRRCMESEKDNIVGTEKALTEKGAKSFYDKLWELIFAAKQSTRPEIKLTYNPPSAWSNFQVRDYVEKELPAIDLDKFCPSVGEHPGRGRDYMLDMGEAEFIILAQSSAKDGETVSVEDAKGLHSKMWKLENDTWNAERKTILARRQDESTETGTGNTLQFLDTRLDDASVYAKGAAATLSLSYTDNSPEAIARREEYLKRDQAILEQWRREQAENGS